MRPLIIAFLILAPFIALAQNYHLHALPALTHVPVSHLAQTVAAGASSQMNNMVHAMQELLS